MTKQKLGRELVEQSINGEPVDFIASNERLRERAATLEHEEHVIETLLNVTEEDEQVWDIGACLGIHTIALAAHNRRVVSFEPMAVNRAILIDNMRINDLSTVVKKEAISDESGSRKFAVRESTKPGYGRHSFDVGAYDSIATQEVRTVDADSLAQAGGVGIPTTVKIDVEGATGLVLDGMKDLLEEELEHVIFELHEPNSVQPSYEDFGYTESEILSMLEDAGFTVETLDKRYHKHAHKS